MRQNTLALKLRVSLMIAALLLLSACNHQGISDIRADSGNYQHYTLYADGNLREVFNEAREEWMAYRQVFGIYHQYGANLGFIDPSAGYVWLASFSPENAETVRIRIYELKGGKYDVSSDFRRRLDARDKL